MMASTGVTLFEQKTWLALFLLLFLCFTVFKKKNIKEAFALFFSTNYSDIQTKNTHYIVSAPLQSLFLSLVLYTINSIFYDRITTPLYVSKFLGVIFGVLIIRSLIDSTILKFYSSSSISRYIFMKENSRVFLAVTFFLPIFLIIINPFFEKIIFVKSFGCLAAIVFLFFEYLMISRSNISFLVFIFYLCIIDLGPVFLLLKYFM